MTEAEVGWCFNKAWCWRWSASHQKPGEAGHTLPLTALRRSQACGHLALRLPASEVVWCVPVAYLHCFVTTTPGNEPIHYCVLGGEDRDFVWRTSCWFLHFSVLEELFNVFAKDCNPLPHILELFPPRDNPDAGSRNGLFFFVSQTI